MEIERTIEMLKIEQECVKRQNTADCSRKCFECNLCQDEQEILEAYDTAIEFLKIMDDWCAMLGEALVNCGFTTVDQLKAFLQEMDGDQTC